LFNQAQQVFVENFVALLADWQLTVNTPVRKLPLRVQRAVKLHARPWESLALFRRNRKRSHTVLFILRLWRQVFNLTRVAQLQVLACQTVVLCKRLGLLLGCRTQLAQGFCAFGVQRVCLKVLFISICFLASSILLSVVHICELLQQVGRNVVDFLTTGAQYCLLVGALLHFCDFDQFKTTSRTETVTASYRNQENSQRKAVKTSL
jgi:hypothetical protein